MNVTNITNLVPDEIFYAIFEVCDVYTASAIKSCCKRTAAYKHTHVFNVYSVNNVGIHIAYNLTRCDRVRYYCIGDMQIWTVHGELPAGLVTWCTCDRIIIRNKKTNFRYVDLLPYNIVRRPHRVQQTNQDWKDVLRNMDNDIILTTTFRRAHKPMPQYHVLTYTLPHPLNVTIEFNIDNNTGECCTQSPEDAA
ncbi:hypothetical protein F-M6_0101 [Faustovirus]|nr:hypothetical protein F-M6_0101 [Faustovirus]